MDRAEATGVGAAVVGHAVLLAALSYGLARVAAPAPPNAIEVSFVDNVELTSAAPEPAASAPPSAAEAGPSEEAEAEPIPEPAPLPRAAPAPPRPKQAERLQRPDRQQQRRTTPRQSNLPDLSSFTPEAGPPRARPAPAAQMTGQAAANIAQAIARQVQPCADRQVYPGPGSERIVTPVILRLNRDGSLATRPRVGAQRGIDDENRRYADRVADLAIRSFVECSPLRGLPDELYDVPNGWQNFTLRYRLPA